MFLQGQVLRQHPAQQAGEQRPVGLAEIVSFVQVCLDGGLVVVAQLPLVDTLQGKLAGAAA